MHIQKEKLAILKELLTKSGIEYVITRTDRDIAHINIWIGEG